MTKIKKSMILTACLSVCFASATNTTRADDFKKLSVADFTDLPLGHHGPETHWRFVYFNPNPNASQCPDPADVTPEGMNVGHWSVSYLFEETAKRDLPGKPPFQVLDIEWPLPPILQKYCLYDYTGPLRPYVALNQIVTVIENNPLGQHCRLVAPQISGLKEDVDEAQGETDSSLFSILGSAKLSEKQISEISDPGAMDGEECQKIDVDVEKDLLTDNMAVMPMGGGSSAESPYRQMFEEEFLRKAGKPLGDWPMDDRARSRLVIVDTAPTGSSWNYPYLHDTSTHGYTLWNMAKEFLCLEGQNRCLADVLTELALSYEQVDIDDKGQSIQNINNGGFVGMVTNLAQAIYRAVRLGDASHTVINLSVSWDPIHGGHQQEWQMPAHLRTVYHALEVASCKRAIVITASGNNMEIARSQSEGKFPALWESRSAPSAARCEQLLGPGDYPDEERPLLWSGTGIDSSGKILRNAAKGSQALLLAYGDHATVEPRDGQNVKTKFLEDSESYQNTAVLTGSSVPAIVISAAAAAMKYYLPDLSAKEIMDLMFKYGFTNTGHLDDFGEPDYYHETALPSNSSHLVEPADGMGSFSMSSSTFSSFGGTSFAGRPLKSEDLSEKTRLQQKDSGEMLKLKVQEQGGGTPKPPSSRVISMCHVVSSACQEESCFPYPTVPSFHCSEYSFEPPAADLGIENHENVTPLASMTPQAYYATVLDPSSGRWSEGAPTAATNVFAELKSVYSAPLTIPQPSGAPPCVSCLASNSTKQLYVEFENPIEEAEIIDTVLLVADGDVMQNGFALEQEGLVYDLDNFGRDAIIFGDEPIVTIYQLPEEDLNEDSQAVLISTVRIPSDTEPDTYTEEIVVSEFMMVQ